MQVLISPISLDEAQCILDSCVDIIDVKNVKEGSLGAQFPWHTSSVVQLARSKGVKASATLGDLPFKPGTAALAALGAATCGVKYVKAGLHGATTYEQAREMMSAVRQACRMVADDIDVVAAGYADYRRFGGLDLDALVSAAADAQCDLVMVDTAIKDGKTLFDALSMEEIRDFVDAGHQRGMRVALAGSLKFEHSDRLFDLSPDIIGVRGAVCEGADRGTRISASKAFEFVNYFHSYSTRTVLRAAS